MAEAVEARNPFLLMLNPELVLAAVEKSERLAQLNRHLCRPLDRIAPVPAPDGSIDEIVRGLDGGEASADTAGPVDGP